MPLDFSIDFDENETPETIEAGNQAPPGWYRAKLEDVHDDEKNPGTVVFQYKVTGGNGGVWTGRNVFDRIGDPDMAEGEDAARFVRQRTKLLAKRLGIITDDEIKPGAQVNKTWYDALGKEVVLHIKLRSYKDKKTGEQKTACGVDYAGVYPLDYDQRKLKGDCPPEARALFTSPPAPAAAAGNAVAKAMRTAAAPIPGSLPAPANRAPATPAPDFSDL